MPSAVDHARRAFVQRAAALASTGACPALALSLAAMGDAAAFTATDYKALVCVFLLGGNDAYNTVVPYDLRSYDTYHAARGGAAGREAGGIALSRASLDATLLRPREALSEGLLYALHPRMGGLANAFNAGRAAVLLNVGPLVMPTTRRQFEQASVPLPPKLFSHNDQQSVWQSESPEGSTSGWGGRIGDLAMASNGSSQFTCISVTGNAVFLAGRQVGQYEVAPIGAPALLAAKYGTFFSTQIRDRIGDLMRQQRSDPFEADYLAVVNRAIDYEAGVNAALEAAHVTTSFAAAGSLGAQLNMVARLIKARAALGVRRQVFFVAMGGFDVHDNQMLRQPSQLQLVSEAFTAFDQAMLEIGVSDGVTAFTASDFGRTLSHNGDGSDHGWGAHHLIIGGAVRGGSFYGRPPPLGTGDSGAPEDQQHVGRGRLLPTTSLAQFGATLGRWFGASDNELLALFPNLANFGGADYPRNLGFLR